MDRPVGLESRSSAGRRRWPRAFLAAIAAVLSLWSAGARAGCGTIVTFNPTDQWAWITIYDLAKTTHMDYGYVAPHSVRSWTGGASVLKYACGSFYHVRYEVKGWTQPGEPPSGTPNIFDTNMQINPQLTLADALSLLKSIGTALSCLDASCLVKWGINQATSTAMFGPVGSHSTDSVVCLATIDNKAFWLEHSTQCAKPPAGYLMMPPIKAVPVGSSGPQYTFTLMKNGVAADAATLGQGMFSADNTAIVAFKDPHHPEFQALKAGMTQVHWSVDGQPRASAVIMVH